MLLALLAQAMADFFLSLSLPTMSKLDSPIEAVKAMPPVATGGLILI